MKIQINIKKSILALSLVLLSLAFMGKTTKTLAYNSAGVSASFAAILKTQTEDTRVEALRSYLKSMDSPLEAYAADYVNEADKNSLPWDLVISIAGTESSLGKAEPCNNSYGFGVYGDNMLCFTSVKEGIATVSKALKERYIDGWHCKDIDEIGKYYAASNTWSMHTKYFMGQIEDYKVKYDQETLHISL